MKVSGINHINIEVTQGQLAEVQGFYQKILGLKEGFRALSTRNGAWLYCEEIPVVHLSVSEEPLTSNRTHFNHVAFACSGVASCIELLKDNHIDYTFRFAEEPLMSQVFIFDPVGIKVELNFAGERFKI